MALKYERERSDLDLIYRRKDSPYGGLSLPTKPADGTLRVFHDARSVAMSFGQHYIGTEHLAIVLDGTPGPRQILECFGVEEGKLKNTVTSILGPDNSSYIPERDIDWYTPRTKHIIIYSVEEAQQASDKILRPEHLLLGAIREEEGIAGMILDSFGIKLPEARKIVLARQQARLEGQDITDQPIETDFYLNQLDRVASLLRSRAIPHAAKRHLGTALSGLTSLIEDQYKTPPGS